MSSIDHRIEKARDHFKITKPEDWCEIRPEWIKQVHNVGPRTLDLIRLYLAARGLTLKDDGTPSFWQQNLQTSKIGGQIAITDKAITEEFTILIDSQEKHPWTFQGLGTEQEPLIVPFKWQTLGPSHGDYSVAGCEGYVHVERKSIEDALGTFLSHGDRRDRWINTLEFLAEIPAGCVVIEGTQGQCLAAIQPRGKRSLLALRNEFLGSVISWSSDYAIPFWFIDSRRLAERFAHKVLKRGWRMATEQKRRPVSAAEIIAELC
jgi:hypothetical protein